MPHLIVSDIHKHYGDDTSGYAALRGLSFSVEAGEFVAVRGPSGCGKSTLLHIVGAMDRPTQGEVLLDDRRLDTLSNESLAQVRRRSIGFVFQSYNLLPTLNVVENVSLPMSLDGQDDRQSLERARQALDEVGLASKSASYPSQLSGGEMQRVAIARALAIEPELMIADEPTGSLDSENGVRILELMTRLNQSRNLTILMATHCEEAASFASRSLHIRDGRLVEADSAHAFPETV